MARCDTQLAAQLARIRALCTALPEVTEGITWGTDINFRVRLSVGRIDWRPFNA
jgi:hypothetical protein